MKIEIIKTTGGAAAKFPFELKDDFRAAFPSAKWNGIEKRWEVGPRSVKRLQQWIDEVNASGIIEEIAARDEADMSEREVEALRRSIETIRSQIGTIEKNIDRAYVAKKVAAKLRKELADASASIESKEAELAAARAEQVAAEEALQSARREASASAVGEDVVAEIESIRYSMIALARRVNPENRVKYGALRERLSDIRKSLDEAGVEHKGLNPAANLDWNKATRDTSDLKRPLEFAA